MKNPFLSVSSKDWLTALFVWWAVCFCGLFLLVLADGDSSLLSGAGFAAFSPFLVTFIYPADFIEGRHYMWPSLFLHPLLDLPLLAIGSSLLRKSRSARR